MEMSPGKYWGMKRLADASGRFKMMAADQRPPIKNLINERRGTEAAPYSDVCEVKAALVRELTSEASAVLLDPHYAYPAAIGLVPAAKGLLLTLEDSVFDESPEGRLSAEIDHWSVTKIKRTGADAVKVLAWYRPDASAEVLDHQHQFVARIGDACRRFDIPFVFELLVYPMLGESGHTTDYVEQPGKKSDHVLRSVEAFSGPEYGIDLFKLECPINATNVPDPDDNTDDSQRATDLFAEMGRLAERPWVMLSAGAEKEQFHRILAHAYRAGASGYLAGRAIWWEAFQNFPDLGAMSAALRSDGVEYMRRINRLTDEQAMPWTSHQIHLPSGPSLAGAGPGFRESYANFREAN